MSTRQKILLVAVAVLVVALYATSAGAGDAGSGRPGSSNAALTWLAGLPGARREIPPELVTGDCLSPGGAIRVVRSCRLQVADPGSTKLVTLSGRVPFRVTASGSTGDIAVDKSGEAQTRVAVNRAAEITLGCDSGCDLTLGGSHG